MYAGCRLAILPALLLQRQSESVPLHAGGENDVRMTRIGFLAGAVAVLAMTLAPSARALRTQERPGWQFGVGMGYGRGSFDDPDGERASYRNGPAFQLRLGRTFGQHAQVGLHYDTWMIEYGEVPTKYRNVQQGLGLGFTWFPGNPRNATGGIYLRVSGGMGWIGLAEKEAIPGEAQGEGERIDEWGYNLIGDAGYEFWIARNFTAGIGAMFGYLGIDESLVDRAGFAALCLNLNLYF